MMTVLETRVLMMFARTAPHPLRAKSIPAQVDAVYIEVINTLRHLYDKQLIIGCIVDGVIDKLGPDDLESWRFYITKLGCEEVMRVSR